MVIGPTMRGVTASVGPRQKPPWVILTIGEIVCGELDRGLRYLKARFPRAEVWQISATGTKDHVSREGIRVAPALTFLGQLI